jgi:hypothetical protein
MRSTKVRSPTRQIRFLALPARIAGTVVVESQYVVTGARQSVREYPACAVGAHGLGSERRTEHNRAKWANRARAAVKDAEQSALLRAKRNGSHFDELNSLRQGQ